LINPKWAIGCGIVGVVGITAAVIYAQRAFKPQPKTTRTEIVQRGDVEIKVVETGSIEPLRKVDVKSKAGGRISRLFEDAGGIVHQGQVIATIDPQEINSQVEALRAQMAGAQARMEAARKTATYQASQTVTGIDQYVHNLAAAQARLHQAEAEARVQPRLTKQSIAAAQGAVDAAISQAQALQDSLNLLTNSTHPQAIVSAQSAYDTAVAQETNSGANFKRQKNLFAKGFVSQQALDAAQTDHDVARAHTREVKERLDRVKQANALEEQNMKSQIASAQSTVRQAQATLDQAVANVTPEMKQRDLESARAAYSQANAQLNSARSSKTQDLVRQDDVSAAKADVRQLQNQLDQILVQQHDTTILATMSGMITKRYVEQGELVTSAIGSFSQGTAISQLADLATMLIKININEVDIDKVKIALPAEVTVDAAKGAIFRGHVRKVSPSSQDSGAAGAATPAATTQTVIRFPVEVQLDVTDPRLKPGMSARCSIICTRRKNVLRVPINCLTGQGSTGTVQVVTNTMKEGKPVETVEIRTVGAGVRGDDFVEITTGLKEGEKLRPNPYTGPPVPKMNFRDGGDGG
jgi:HlyD family secretion protein